MTNFKTALILGAAVLLVAPFAQAGDMNPVAIQAQADSVMTQDQAQAAQFGNAGEVAIAVEKTAVLSTVAVRDADSSLIPVTDEMGRTYYNRVINVEELPDTELDLSVIDTIEISHDDRVFTNKIVKIEN